MCFTGTALSGFVFAVEAQEQNLGLDIQLVSESDKPENIVNTIVFPNFSALKNTHSNNGVNQSNSGKTLTGQEKAAQAKSQAYGLVKENKKEKVKKEKVSNAKDKAENSHKP